LLFLHNPSHINFRVVSIVLGDSVSVVLSIMIKYAYMDFSDRPAPIPESVCIIIPPPTLRESKTFISFVKGGLTSCNEREDLGDERN